MNEGAIIYSTVLGDAVYYSTKKFSFADGLSTAKIVFASKDGAFYRISAFSSHGNKLFTDLESALEWLLE